ncbi:amino acid ABC transporter substrate-binding protein [Desulfocurvibacter africanus]|uniref:Leucine-binding protein domain-containing protein n=1 Tax=Desulfocurvibacter africanus subsp. africanus str. Walvis Bay TaxID=690850 RepID=F3Z404_DESAF|nr:hypothetical protein [Desulfocurvibacter africanus]EGJ50456.1 hypothetical protein Desaf_2127 [Desulfocurvibacter africanus subsp. africanus str. Walvis Bay]
MSRIVTLLLLACGLLLSSACQKAPVIPAPQLQALPTQEILNRADAAWTAEDYQQSLTYYGEAQNRTDLSGQKRALSYERAARSALAVKEYERSLQSLRGWAGFDAKVRQTWPWNEYYATALAGSGQDDQLQDFLAGLIVSRQTTWDVRRNAALFQADHFLSKDRPMAAVPALREVYDTAPNREAKASLEQTLLVRLLDLDDKQAIGLLEVGEGQELTFPYSVMRLAAAKRLAETKPKQWDTAWRELRVLLTRGRFADDSLPRVTLRALESQRGAPRTGIALAVPLSDKIGVIGWKIVTGANIAQKQLALQGLNVEVRVVNTSRPGWLNDLNALPPGFTVVGGPLLRSDFQQIVDSKLTRERVFMTFLQSLGELDEGRDAWRFFASPQDQVRALLDLAAGKFGLSEFAVLTPQEPFGTYMTEIFSQEVWDRGLTMAAYGTYPPKTHTAWGGKVAELLGLESAASPGKSGQLPPEPGFRAVFLPDGWTQAQLLAPQFYYYDAEHTLLMGSELWSQAIIGGTDADLNYFGLAVCPGPWWAQSQRSAVRELTRRMADENRGQPDFWHALGYDFVRFAANLGNLPGGWDRKAINERLSTAPAMDWSLAPMSWSQSGKARQDLFLFQPSRKGLVPVDAQELFTKMQQVKQRHDERMELNRAKLEQKAKTAKPVLQGAAQ